MNANEIISSKILSDVEIIADIYSIVKAAGLAATNDKEVKSLQKEVCTIKPDIMDVIRFSKCKPSTNSYSIEYDANDIMIVGGAALNVYDYKLREFKERRRLGALETYIKKKTSDIDIVWWPRKASNTDIIISTSTAIIELVRVFKEKLQEKLNEASKELELKIKRYITNASNADKLKIDVSSIETRVVGVFNITIIFQIKEKILKICDIVIHDSGASQRYDPDGNQINYVTYMNFDPLYCNPMPGLPNSIKYLTVNGIDIAVPNIESFVKQQMLAFDNLIRLNEVKGFNNYKRVEFIKQLLSSFVNLENSSDFLEVFGTDSQEILSYYIYIINKRVNESINKLDTQIIGICKTTNTSTDKIVEELCTKARQLLKNKERQAFEREQRIAAQKYAIEAMKSHRHKLASQSPAFSSAANIPPGYFGWAPPSPPPHFAADIYVEYGTNRPMIWNNHYGRYYYLTLGPGVSPLAPFTPLSLSGQPPLPDGPPPPHGHRTGSGNTHTIKNRKRDNIR